MTTFHNPRPPVDVPVLGSSPGVLVRINGCTPYESKSFTVNLLCYPEGHIALQIKVKLDEKCVIVSTIVNSQVVYQERDSRMVIQPGHTFELLILFCEWNFKVGFKGQHFLRFPHRVPYYSVTNLGIDGEVILHAISFERNVTSQKIGFVIPPNTNNNLRPGPAYQAPYPTNVQNRAGSLPPNYNNMYLPQMGYGGYGNQRPLYPQQAPAGYVGGYLGSGNLAYHNHPQLGYLFSENRKSSGLLPAGMAMAGILGTSVSVLSDTKPPRRPWKPQKKASNYGLP